MSTAAGAIGGKERTSGINFWLLILVVALVIFGFNFYRTTVLNSQEGHAKNLVADIQVLSQQIAKFAAEATGVNLGRGAM